MLKKNMEDNHVERFDKISDEYLKALDKSLLIAGGDGRFFYQSKLDHLERTLPVKPRQILDFGCGPGIFTRMLATRFPQAQVVGYDPAEECVRVAQRESQGGTTTYTADLKKLNMKPDLVVATGVLHHIPIDQKQTAIQSIYDILTPGGSLYVFEHNPLNPATRLIVGMSPYDDGATLIRCGRMAAMLRQAQFQQVSKTFISFFPPFLKILMPLEKYLEKVPLGAQYFVKGTRP